MDGRELKERHKLLPKDTTQRDAEQAVITVLKQLASRSFRAAERRSVLTLARRHEDCFAFR